jgi:hypothetical protein
MVTEYFQDIWFEGDEYVIHFSDTSANDREEAAGMQLLDVDGLDRFKLPGRIWEFCEQQMDPAKAETAEERFRW